MKTFILALGTVVLAAVSQASIVSFSAVGAVTAIYDPYSLLGPTVNLADPVSVTVTYETTDTLNPVPYFSGVRYYFSPATQVFVNAMVGTHAVTSISTYSFLDSSNTGSSYTYWGGTPIGSYGVNQFGAYFSDPLNTYPTSGLFPTAPGGPLPSMTDGNFTMQYADDNPEHGAGAIVTGTLINPNATPEPASMAALGLGVVGLIRRRNRVRKIG